MQQREFELTVQGTLSFRNVDRIHRSTEAEFGKGQWRLSRATPCSSRQSQPELVAQDIVSGPPASGFNHSLLFKQNSP